MSESTIRDFLLQTFNEDILQSILPKLGELGCEQVEDLFYLETEDIESLGLSKISQKKLLLKIQSLKESSTVDDGRQDLPQKVSQKLGEKIEKREEEPEIIRKALIKLQIFLTEKKIGLTDFFRQEKKDSAAFNRMIEVIIIALKQNSGFPYNSLALFTFHRITRMQCLKALLDKIKQECFVRKRIRFPLETRKMLIWTLLNNCTEELRLQLLLLLSQFSSIPLLSLSQIQDNPFELKYNLTPEIYWILKPMPAMLCVNIGLKKQTKIINMLFGTDFDEDPYLDHGSVDMQFDLNYKPPKRGFSILKTDHHIQEKVLFQCVKFSSIYMLSVHYDELEDHLNIITDFYNKIEKYTEGLDEKLLFLTITGFTEQDFLFEAEASDLFKQQHGLENLTKLAVLVLPDQSCDNSDMISKITQQNLISEIQTYLTSKSAKIMSHMDFLDNFRITDYEEENRLIEDFLNTVEKNTEDFYNQNFLPMYYHYSTYCKTMKKMTGDFQIWQNQNEYNQLAGELAQLDHIMRGLDEKTPVKPTDILHQFVKILSKKNSFLLVYAISNRLKVYVDKRLGPEKKLYFDARDRYHRLKSHDKNDPQLPQLELEISNLHKNLERKTISLEIIWRELVQFYCYQETKCFDIFGEQDPMQIFSKYTEKGLPFEIIDGDNIRLPEKFLKTAILPQHKKVLAISIIGPQSSGKSTLLNYLFGCQFATSSGRCTKGIYGTLFDCSFGDYDGLLLLDTEGLFSPEKSDPEYDRKIVLFCFAVSHIVLINVRGDLNRNMQEVLSISLNVLDELKVSKVPSPTIFFVLNQNPDPNVENHLSAFNKIIESLSEAVDVNKMLNISEETLIVLPSAFSDVSVYDDEVSTRWIILMPSNVFGNECSNLLNKIWEEAEKRMARTQDCAPFNNIQEWNTFAQDIWSTIENFKGLIYLNEMKEIRQLEQVKAIILDFVKREFEEDAPARELQHKIFSIVKRNEKKEVAELELEHFWERKTELIKPAWQECLKGLRLTVTVSERADYFFRSHINIQKSRSFSKLHSQLDEMQARNDTINGEIRIQKKIRSIVNDYTNEITEGDARSAFEQLFAEITHDMEKKQNLEKVKFGLKSELYTQYHMIGNKLPELNVICENTNQITFDKTCLSSKSNSKPDIFLYDLFSHNYLNFSSHLIPIEYQTPGGVRILLALYHTDWDSLFTTIRKLPPNNSIDRILAELNQELESLGLGLTGNCYKELEDFHRNALGSLGLPTPKNSWLTIHSSNIIFYGRELYYIDAIKYIKEFEKFQQEGNLLHLKSKGFWETLSHFFRIKKVYEIEAHHTTYSSSSSECPVDRWLINPYTAEISHDDLLSHCLHGIEFAKITTAIDKIISKNLNEAFKDSPQITMTRLKFISTEISKIIDNISTELSHIGLRLTLPGEGRLHEYAFTQILKFASVKILEEQQKNIKVWVQEKERLKEFFISQVMVKKSEESDKALAQNIAKAIEDEIIHALKMKAQGEYNIILERNKDLFTRDTLQTIADGYLINSEQPDLVFEYIINPATIFNQEFKKSWNSFLDNSSKDILRAYKTAHYSVDSCIDFFKDIGEQLKKFYHQKSEREIFQIDLTDWGEFPEDFSKRAQQAQSEAPLIYLGRFLQKQNFQSFKINGFSFEVDLSLSWNVDLHQDEIQQKIIQSLTKESYQTWNLTYFLHHFIKLLEGISERIANITFPEIQISLQKNEMRLLAIGCTKTCPVCGRICDATHGSEPGCEFDRHECKKGHQYDGMNGCFYSKTKEAVLKTCNDQKDGNPWIWNGVETTWSQLKESELLKEWAYDNIPSEQAVLNGKFYRAWMIAGEKICEFYNIVHHNRFDQKFYS